MREKSRFPNNFAQKLRKHIRNRRIEAIRQIGFVFFSSRHIHA